MTYLINDIVQYTPISSRQSYRAEIVHELSTSQCTKLDGSMLYVYIAWRDYDGVYKSKWVNAACLINLMR
jgi:hypothetical protein